MTIRYNESIKKPEETIEYTPDMIKTLSDCQDDIWFFLEYIKVVHPDRGLIKFEPYDFQKKILKNLQNHRFNIILASRQSGKCLSYYTTISVRNKKTGEIKDVFIGDLFKENHK